MNSNVQATAQGKDILLYFREHPIFFIGHFFSMIFLIAIPSAVFFFFSSIFDFTSEVKLLFIITMGLVIFGTFVRLFVFWRGNVNFITEDQIIMFRFTGLLSSSHESRSLRQMNSVDMKQRGMWQHLFNCGNIYFASIMSGNAVSIVLKNVYPVRHVHSFLTNTIAHLDDQKNSEEENSDASPSVSS